MRFSHPTVLYALMLMPLLFMILFFVGKRRQKEKERIGNLNTLDRFSKKPIEGNVGRDTLFIVCAIFFFVLSLAGPQAGTRLEPVKITGSDIFIAIDLSQSMQAEDIRPSRFERAKIDALELLEQLQGDRVGLILFAGDAFVQCPLTADYDAVTTFISSIDSETAVAGGTTLFAPLEVALDSIDPEADKYSILLLLTDGENTGLMNNKILRDLVNRGIKVFSVGIGTKDGAPIPLFDESGRRVGYKKDASGQVILSRLSDEHLKEIAEKTDGYYFEAGEQMNEIFKFLATVNAMKKRELETKRYTVYEERYQIPLALGILFVVLFSLLSVKTKKTKRSGL